MLLHLFIDTVTLTADTSPQIISLLLHILINNQEKYQLSSPTTQQLQLQQPNINFCQTIYIPIDNPEISLTDVNFSALGYTSDGKYLKLGQASCLISFHEHGLTKTLTLMNKKSIVTGQILLTVFYYQFPINISSYNDPQVIENHSKQHNFHHEYSFLRSRSLNWKGNRLSTWNNKTQRLLDNDESIQYSRELCPPSSSSPSPSPSAQPSSSLSKLKQKKSSIKENNQHHNILKLRKTNMSVGYIGDGVIWPHNGISSSTSSFSPQLQEKLQYKLYLAEERRLHLKQKYSDLIRKKNKQFNEKYQQIRNHQQRQSHSEEQLRELLKLKENSIKKLEKQLNELKYSSQHQHQHQYQHSRQYHQHEREGRGEQRGERSRSLSRGRVHSPEMKTTRTTRSGSSNEGHKRSHHNSNEMNERMKKTMEKKKTTTPTTPTTTTKSVRVSEEDPLGYNHILLFKQRKENEKLKKQILKEKKRNGYIGMSHLKNKQKRSTSLPPQPSTRSHSLSLPLPSPSSSSSSSSSEEKGTNRIPSRSFTSQLKMKPKTKLLISSSDEREEDLERKNNNSIWDMLIQFSDSDRDSDDDKGGRGDEENKSTIKQEKTKKKKKMMTSELLQSVASSVDVPPPPPATATAAPPPPPATAPSHNSHRYHKKEKKTETEKKEKKEKKKLIEVDELLARHHHEMERYQKIRNDDHKYSTTTHSIQDEMNAVDSAILTLEHHIDSLLMKPPTNRSTHSSAAHLTSSSSTHQPHTPKSNHRSHHEGRKVEMVLSGLQKRLESIQNNIQSSPSYLPGGEEHNREYDLKINLNDSSSSDEEEEEGEKNDFTSQQNKNKQNEIIWSNSFLDNLSNNHNLEDQEEDEDEEEEGIWPHEWSSSGMASIHQNI